MPFNVTWGGDKFSKTRHCIGKIKNESLYVETLDELTAGLTSLTDGSIVVGMEYSSYDEIECLEFVKLKRQEYGADVVVCKIWSADDSPKMKPYFGTMGKMLNYVMQIYPFAECVREATITNHPVCRVFGRGG